MNGKNDIDILIRKYLTGEASAAERQQVLDWCAESAANQKIFDHFSLVHEKSTTADSDHDVTEAARQKVSAKISTTKTRQLFPAQVWRIAASLLLISVLGYLVYWQIFAYEKDHFSNLAEVTAHELPGNTELFLNRNSTATVTYRERNKSGVVRLSGEATLKIHSAAGQSWMVMVDRLIIRNIGTVFTVRAFPDEDVVEVTVDEGEVQFYTNSAPGILLKAGEAGVYDKVQKQFYRRAASPNAQAFHTLEFTFRDVDLKTIINQLSRVYNRDIRITPNLENCRLTFSFRQEELDTILEVIAETLNLMITDDGQVINISGPGCP